MSALNLFFLQIILTAVIGLVVGIVAGVLLSGLRSRSHPADQTGVTEQSDLDHSGLEEEMRVWRQTRSGKLVIEVEKQLFYDVGDISVKRFTRLTQLGNEIRQWLGVAKNAESQLSASAPSTGEASDAAANLPVLLPVQAEKPKRGFLNPVEAFIKAISADVPKSVSQPVSIAAQIDEVLQEKLAESPLKDRAIRLMEIPEKGMVVLVAMEQYDGVEAVPDEEVRELLRSCVKEWESRTGR